LYNGFPTLHLQVNKKTEFVTNPDWYFNIEYMDEVRRGYESMEDLFVPGYFEFSMRKGECVIFSAGVKEVNPGTLKTLFSKALAVRPPRNDYVNCLKNSADQFISHREHRTEVVAGFPFYGAQSRDTLVSLPGLTLGANFDPKTCKTVLDSLSKELENGRFTDIDKINDGFSRPVDAPLWYFWTIGQYALAVPDTDVWALYGKKMKAVLKAYADGTNADVKLHDNGLIWAEENGKPITWMNAVVNGKPVVSRSGYQVEVNALWYNAVCYALALAKAHKEIKFVKEWTIVREKIEQNFLPVFWSESYKYLADYVGPAGQDVAMRPNQLFACALPYSPLPDEVKRKVLLEIARQLLTPKGIRTLSPTNPQYKGRYEGDHIARFEAQHQGTVYPWLLPFYIEANLNLHGKSFLSTAKDLVAGFEEDMNMHGLCAIPELYHGDPPHSPHGCISQAWSVAGILRSMQLIARYE
jgi:predicted glycogen debranching enzyme